MITHNGTEIPDPPTDPEEKKRWKTIYFAALYGASQQQIDTLMATPVDPPKSLVSQFLALLAIGWLTACALLVIVAVIDAFSWMW